MANISVRTFDGVDDLLELTLGDRASSATVPGTWMWAGRILAAGADGELIHAPGFDPLDWYVAAAGTPKFQFYNGASDATDGPAVSTTLDAIVVMRQVSGGPAKWSIATHNGSVWSSFTHTNSAATFTNRNFPGSGTVSVGGIPYLNARYALIGHASTALSDAEIATLTTDRPSWLALSTLTNLIDFGATPVVDLKGTMAQSSIVGTTVTTTAFPLDAGSSGVTGTAAVTLAADTSTAAGTFGFVGAAAVTLGNDTATASGTHTAPSVTGTAAVTLAGDTATATGIALVSGTAAVTLSAATATASGTVGTPVTYVLEDDFAGSAIDLGKWRVYNRIGDLVNNEVNGVIPANVRVASGTLFIDSKHETIVIGDSETAPQSVDYTSAQIAQAGPSFLYGDVQVRAKIPGGIGLWPCIWMLGFEWQASQPYTANTPGHNWPVDGWCEIDIAEFALNHRDAVNCQLHYGTNHPGGEQALPFNATTRFMVYRLLWEPGALTWMVDAEDGVGWRTLYSVTGTPGSVVPDVPMYLIIHTAIGGVFGGTPDSSTFPQSMEVDYARVIATDDTEVIVGGTAAVTLDGATATASGTAFAAVTGTAATTLASDTATATGTHSISGTAAVTLGSDTSTAAGTAGAPGSGSAAVTLGDDVATASGTFTLATITGTAAVTLGDDTATASGTVIAPGSGSAAVTLAGDTADGSGAVGVSGAAAVTLAGDVGLGAGTHIVEVTGSAAVTLADDVASAFETLFPLVITGVLMLRFVDPELDLIFTEA